MTTYKNYNISFKTTNPGMIKGAEPWLYFIHDIANLNYFSAISPEAAFKGTANYLINSIKSNKYVPCIDEKKRILKFYNRNSEIVCTVYDFKIRELKKYKISFRTATPAMLSGVEAYSDIRNDDAIQDYITAENEAEAISLALQYLHDDIDTSIAATCEIDEEAQEITYYDEGGQIQYNDIRIVDTEYDKIIAPWKQVDKPVYGCNAYQKTTVKGNVVEIDIFKPKERNNHVIQK